ncbi:MAG: helix-turn-helix domain-containing protein [Lentilitoribacter sp.]
MSERRPFREIKLQWLEQLSCDAGLSDSAKCVALHIITRYVNGHTEEAWPSYQTIASAIGKSIKTIQRAIHDLELGGWFDVVRGNGSRVSTRYRPTEASIVLACKAREKTDKIVTLHPDEGGQNCPKRRSKMSNKGRQNRPPNLENKNNKKLNGREEAPPLVERRRAIPALFVPKRETEKLDRWQKWFSENHFIELENVVQAEIRNGTEGFILPSYYPPMPEDEHRHQASLEYFQNRQKSVLREQKLHSRLAS